jgi:hypothetical protein
MSGMAAALSPGSLEEFETGSPTTALTENDAGNREDLMLQLPVITCEIRLNFKKTNADSISLSGAVFTGSGYLAAGQTVTIDIGGVTQTFTLDKRGRAKSGNATFVVKTFAGSGLVDAPAARFMLQIKKGTLAETFANENLTGTASVKNVIRIVPMRVSIAGVTHQINRTLIYTSRAGMFGIARFDPDLDENEDNNSND